MREADTLGELSQQELLVLHYFLDYIGNTGYGLIPAALAVIEDMLCAMVKERATKEKTLNMIRITRKWFPYAIFILFYIYNFDTETFQTLPGSFGKPELMDIPAGLIGMLTGALLFELYRKGIKGKLEKVIHRKME